MTRIARQGFVGSPVFSACFRDADAICIKSLTVAPLPILL
ncbi:hypothetical protein A0R60_2645 [Enterobacter asburiae]|nr:hypothetical protein A0R60_2645 [Enterobacter asburiae]